MKPQISVIIPVFHEEPLINTAIDRLNPIRAVRETEILVVDGDPEGSTLRSITDPAVGKITSPAGRGKQMNAGARAAAGGILVFLHVDTILPETAGRAILEVCQDANVIGGAFDLAIDATGLMFRIIEKAASFRSRLTRIPYGDQALFMKAEYFRRLEGFRDIPLMEDIDFMRRVKRGGYRIRFVSSPVKTSARRWEKEGIIFTTIRNWTLSTLFYAGVSPERLKKYYR